MMFQNEITKEEVDGLKLIQFDGPIHVIESSQQLDDEMDRIERHGLLGFDTETKPSFKKGKVHPTSLIQLATSEESWIIRASRVGTPERLLKLLSREDVLKVGLGLTDDLRRLRSDYHFEPAGFLDLQQYVEAFRIEEKGLKKMTAIVLGRRISKSQQVSNWDADPLTEAQLRYAATDAWVCLRIYHALRNSIPRSDD